MDFVALEIFCAVALDGSVTRAAERLQRVQSNVTTRVRQLEDALGSALFLRTGKRMALTPEGQVFLGYAQQLLALAEEARQALHPGQPQGRLRLGAMESTAASRLPGPLAQFHGQWPGVALELCTGASQALLERLRTHALDAVLIAWPPGQPADPALQAVPVFREELLLALPGGHAAIDGPQQVQPATLAVFEPGCTYRRMAQQWLAARTPPMQLLELGSYHAILACVAAGNCVGVVPRSVLELARAPPALRLHPLQSVDTLLVRRAGYRSAALDALQQTLLGAGADTGSGAGAPASAQAAARSS